MLRLALDTGATGTLVNAGPLVSIGYDPVLATRRVQITTGSGLEFVPQFAVSRISAFGHDRTSFPVLSHTLPQSSGVDGLLGLDFLRGLTLIVDFRKGIIELS